MKYPIFLCIITMFYCGLAQSQLDPAREEAFQNVMRRYGKNQGATNLFSGQSATQSPPPKPDPLPTRPVFGDGCFISDEVEEAVEDGEITMEEAIELTKTRNETCVRIFSNSVRIEETMHWDLNFEDEGEKLTHKETLSDWMVLTQEEARYGQSYNRNIIHSLEEEPGHKYLFTSFMLARLNEDEDQPNVLFAQDTLSNERDGRKFTYMGRILHVGNVITNIDQSVTVLDTSSFDPCAVDAKAGWKLRKLLEDNTTQANVGFGINCMITTDLKGEFKTEFIATDKDGEILEKVKLDGALTYQLSKALAIKYSFSNYIGDNPLEDSSTSFSSAAATNDSQPSLPGGSIPIGGIIFRNANFTNGQRHEVSLDYNHSEDGCSTRSSLKVGSIEFEDDTTPTYSVTYLKSCKDEPAPGATSPNYGSRTTSLRFGNDVRFQFERVHNFRITHDRTFANGERLSFGISAADIPASPFYDEEGIAIEFDIEGTQILANGNRRRTTLRGVYFEPNSYVVAEQLFIFPKAIPSNRLKFQRPTGKDGKPFGNSELDINDPDLCRRIFCPDFGVAMTFSSEGGVFLTARGRTITDFFGPTFEMELIGGLPLNDEGVNMSWGGAPSGFRGARPLSEGTGEAFLQLGLTSSNCNILRQFCAQYRIRHEEGGDTELQFGKVREW